MGIMVIYPTWQLCNNDGQQFKGLTEKNKLLSIHTPVEAPRKSTKENLYKSPGKSPYLALCLQPGVYFASHGTFRTPLKNHDTASLLTSPAPPSLEAAGTAAKLEPATVTQIRGV